MKDLNSVQVTGHLVDDSVSKSFSNVKNTRITFKIAINGKARKDSQGNWIDGDPTFIPVVIWTSRPDGYLENYRKGSFVIVTGTLAQANWTSQDGQRHSMLFIKASDSRVLKATSGNGKIDSDIPF